MKVGIAWGKQWRRVGGGVIDKLPGKRSQEENFCGDVNVLYLDWGGGLPGCLHVSKIIHVYN